MRGLIIVGALCFGLGWVVNGWRLGGEVERLTASVASCQAAKGNLEALTSEQGRALGDLVKEAEQRQKRAAAELAASREKSAAEYAAAIRLMQERSGGDDCEAAGAVIDRELGL